MIMTSLVYLDIHHLITTTASFRLILGKTFPASGQHDLHIGTHKTF